jgi:hypothetical protein
MLGVNIRGERELYAAIDRFTETVADQRERGWQENVDVRLDHQRRYMDSEGGGDWQDLNAGYARDKEAAVGNLPVLQYSTRMYKSLTQERAPDYVREETADSLKVGSSDSKARWHHEGRGRLPVRVVIEITDAEGRDHLQVMHDGYEAIGESLGFKVI